MKICHVSYMIHKFNYVTKLKLFNLSRKIVVRISGICRAKIIFTPKLNIFTFIAVYAKISKDFIFRGKFHGKLYWIGR